MSLKELKEKYMNMMEMGEPAEEEALESVEKELSISLPNDYRQFMKESNGAEGDIGEANYLVIWPAEEIAELNDTYGVSEFTPGLVYFGSDGGDTAYAFDKRTLPYSYVRYPFDSIHIENAEFIADSFEGFIKAIYEEE